VFTDLGVAVELTGAFIIKSNLNDRRARVSTSAALNLESSFYFTFQWRKKKEKKSFHTRNKRLECMSESSETSVPTEEGNVSKQSETDVVRLFSGS
jgi:hypothetical protein